MEDKVEITVHNYNLGYKTHHVIQINERVIDGHNLHLLGGDSSPGHQTSDTAKSEIKS